MRIFISADMEGIAGASSWDDVDKDKPEYAYCRDQMNAEVMAACEGAVAAGAQEIVVKDAHASARNIVPERFPECVSLSKGWSGHPYCMMDELDASFDAALMIGYHSRAGSGGSPLAHTMSSSIVAVLRINGRPASEFAINAMTAGYVGVPVAFVSGDEALCREVRSHNQEIGTVATQRGHGRSTVSLHPRVSRDRIRAGVERSLTRDLKSCLRPLPARFAVDIEYIETWRAYARSFYPGARLEDDRRLVFETTDYFEVLRLLHFVL